MKKISLYEFPTVNQGRFEIQTKYFELNRKLRGGERLAREELDWFDWADKFLDRN